MSVTPARRQRAKSSSQPLSLSRAAWRCAGVVAVVQLGDEGAVVVGQPLLVAAVGRAGERCTRCGQRLQAGQVRSWSRRRRRRPSAGAASAASRAAARWRSASQRLGVEGRCRHAGGDHLRCALVEAAVEHLRAVDRALDATFSRSSGPAAGNRPRSPGCDLR